ncbi:hypothetical protein KC318_g9739, partial [Hortaea werneckii]
APSLHPSLAPTFETQTTSNRSSTNRASQQAYLMPQNEKGQSPYGQAGQEAIASSSTLSSTTDPKAQDIKSWSSAFARMQDERLDKQRYEMSGNKSEEVSKLALGAKVERALARRMTGQDAQFTNTMRFGTALENEALPHGDHDFFSCSECGLQLGHVPSPPRGTMHVKRRGVTSPRRSTKAQASGKNVETHRQAAKLQEHAEDFTELPSLNNAAAAAAAAGMSTFVNHYALLHLPVFANHNSIRSAYQDRVKRLDEQSAAAAFEQGITRRLPVSLFEAEQQKTITATPYTPTPRRDSGLGIETILLAGDIHLPIDMRITSNGKLCEIPSEENKKVPDLSLRPPEPNPNQTITNDWTWYPYTSEQICRRNILDAAFNILIHPIKKRRYDLQYLPALQRYQIERIVKDEHQTESQKRLAVRQLGNWVVSLERGRSVEVTVGTVPFPWTREFEEMGSGMDRSLMPVSGMAGEVVQAWVDSMED